MKLPIIGSEHRDARKSLLVLLIAMGVIIIYFFNLINSNFKKLYDIWDKTVKFTIEAELKLVQKVFVLDKDVSR